MRFIWLSCHVCVLCTVCVYVCVHKYCVFFLLIPSAMESHSLLNPNLQNSEGVLSSFRSTWQEFVEDLGFWRVLLLLVIIALLSLGIAYYVSGVLPFSASQLELVHWKQQMHPVSNLVSDPTKLCFVRFNAFLHTN